jgi:hypothetical protein
MHRLYKVLRGKTKKEKKRKKKREERMALS